MIKPLLQILICTFGEDGLRRVAEMDLPVIDGIAYIISCQDPGNTISDTESLLPRRDDISLFIHPDRGLGLNRRHAMEHADAEFVLLADDDLIYDADALRRAFAVMRDNPNLDIFAFRYDGADNKIYPPAEHDLAHPFKNYNLTSVELAFRLKSVRDNDIRFSPLLGVGAPYLTAGEEAFFVERCLRKGLKGRFFPLTILEHPAESTGIREVAAPGVVRANGAFIKLKYGIGEGFLRCLLLAKRLPIPFFRGLRYALQGMWYAARHDRDL